MVTKKMVYPLISSIAFIFTTNSYGVIGENVIHLNNGPYDATDCSEPEPELCSNSGESDDKVYVLSNFEYAFDDEVYFLSISQFASQKLDGLLSSEQQIKFYDRLKNEMEEIQSYINDEDPFFIAKLELELDVQNGSINDNHSIIKTKSYLQEFMNKKGLEFSSESLEKSILPFSNLKSVARFAKKIALVGATLVHDERVKLIKKK